MPRPHSDASESEETVLEFAVRERLTKEQIAELSASLGGPRQGSRGDLAEKLLAIKGLKAKDVLGKLSTEDLKLLTRRFDVPEFQKSTSPSAFFGSLLGDERSALIKRIEEFASKQRSPKPQIGVVGTESAVSPTGVAPTPAAASAGKSGAVTEAPPAPAFTPATPTPPAHEQMRPSDQGGVTSRSSPAPNLVGGPGAGEFDDLCHFLEAYTFTKRWDEEILYEAELAGAISGHFRNQKVVHQMAVGGTRADIVACGAVIEIKYPKTKQPLQTLTGQVEGYQKLFGNRVVVVLCTGGLRDTQAFNDSAASLSERGAKVFIK
jgi:hypothetical protein